MDLLLIYDFELAPYYVDNTGEIQHDRLMCTFKWWIQSISHYSYDETV